MYVCMYVYIYIYIYIHIYAYIHAAVKGTTHYTQAQIIYTVSRYESAHARTDARRPDGRRAGQGTAVSEKRPT